MHHLSEIFHDYFEMIQAKTPALLDEALRLRYQVYCLETGYERHTQFTNGIEYDQFDLFSVHSIIKHKDTGIPAANTRLILPRSQKSDFHFPIQDLVSPEQIQDVVKFNKENMSDFAEISRFCVSRDFKKRYQEGESIAGVREVEETKLDIEPESLKPVDDRLLPHITIALMATVFKMSAEEDVKHWFAIMEPSLLRFLRRYGIDFVPIGSPVHFRGIRQPCYAFVDDVAVGMWKKRREVWKFVTDNGKVWPLPDGVGEDERRKVASNG